MLITLRTLETGDLVGLDILNVDDLRIGSVEIDNGTNFFVIVNKKYRTIHYFNTLDDAEQELKSISARRNSEEANLLPYIEP